MRKTIYICCPFRKETENTTFDAEKLINIKFKIRPARQREYPLLNTSQLTCRIRQWKMDQVISTKKGSSPLFLTDLCRQKGRPPHCMSNYSNNFTCLSFPPEGPDIMSPPVKYPHAFPQFHQMHTGAVTLN